MPALNFRLKLLSLIAALLLGCQGGPSAGSSEWTVLYYNKEMFREAGLDPEHPPRTWDELVAYADRLTVRREDGTPVRAGLSLRKTGFKSVAALPGYGEDPYLKVFLEQQVAPPKPFPRIGRAGDIIGAYVERFCYGHIGAEEMLERAQRAVDALLARNRRREKRKNS